jgi:hypothetical protein
MNSISISYALVWRLDFAPEYQWDKDGNCYNVQRGTKLKKVYQSRCIGYNIRGKFYSLRFLRMHVEKIPISEVLPF